MNIRIIVAGAFGKMGNETCNMIEEEERFQLVAIVDPKMRQRGNAPVFPNVSEALQQVEADVFVDFTTPSVVYEHVTTAIQFGVRPVIGTTGLNNDQIAVIQSLCEEKEIGAIIAPNFSVGAILMMKFAQMAANYFPHVEIIEYHHEKKIDAPSGTAIKTADLIQQTLSNDMGNKMSNSETLSRARGANYEGIQIHSVRLPGLLAHQEVIFGGDGQLLTIRHDTLHRSSFMPGVKFAIFEVMKLKELVYGLEQLIG